MTTGRATIGVDFGTESARAVLVEVETGRELASAVHRYPSGVIDQRLPDGRPLPPEWALQDPDDYLESLGVTVRSVLGESGMDPASVIGIGIDFTACTMLPVTADGTPLCRLPDWRSNPHSWVKLWKHHAAQPEADLINETAARRGEKFLDRYGRKTSSEWFFAKSLQILDEAPEVYARADRLIEAADWVVWQLTGQETRNSCTAGYKALWSKGEGFPDRDFFAALAPGFADVVDEKMSRQISSQGDRAGVVSAAAAELTGLAQGTPVAVANVDAHVSVPAATVVGPGRLVAVMGTSTCHLALSDVERVVPGFCGVVEDGVIPGLFGYEAGQTAVGDMFAWFTDLLSHGESSSEALHRSLEQAAGELSPGESGLVALDWWNGNRSVLVDAELTGVLMGATLATTPPDIYRALLEATVFGTRVIIETLESSGVPIAELVVCGGLPFQNRLLMQLSADITGRPVKVAASRQTPALGSAMFAAVAAGTSAGGYASIVEASENMARLGGEEYTPSEESREVYDDLYGIYRDLHDTYAAPSSEMRRLRSIQRRVQDMSPARVPA
ncbi:MAG TPA: ribulokinase [Acidimicrobiia bacterium]|nr:ribulokinase [Acidimicrobiia bacterium]